MQISPSLLKKMLWRGHWHQLERNVNEHILNAQCCLPAKTSLGEMYSHWTHRVTAALTPSSVILCYCRERSHLVGEIFIFLALLCTANDSVVTSFFIILFLVVCFLLFLFLFFAFQWMSSCLYVRLRIVYRIMNYAKHHTAVSIHVKSTITLK